MYEFYRVNEQFLEYEEEQEKLKEAQKQAEEILK